MPVRYIGRDTTFQGKTLWDILCRLKNFGVGRMVYRQQFQRYPEPSYYIITQVEPDMTDPIDSRQSNARGLKIFRGENFGEQPIKVGFKADWRLVHRDEEDAFRNKQFDPRPHNIIADRVPFPPLLERLVREELKLKGKEVPEKLSYEISIRQKPVNRAMMESEAKQLENM